MENLNEITYSVDEFEKIYDEYLEENEPEVVAEFFMDGSLVSLFGPVALVTGFEEDLYVAEGVWCEKDEESGEYMPDWSLSWFWRASNRPEDYVYYEQDGIPVSLHNLKHMVGEENVGYVSLGILKEQPSYIDEDNEKEEN